MLWVLFCQRQHLLIRMRIAKICRLNIFHTLIVLTFLGLLMSSNGRGDETLTLFLGRSNKKDLLELIRFKWGRFEPYSVIGVAYRRSLFQSGRYYQFEWGGNLVKHLEKWSLLEGDALVVFRWKWAPWNEFVKTSLGVGEGLSLVTGYPSSESVSQPIRSHFLNYLWVDVRFELPDVPAWAVDSIIHHRSGIYGLFGVSGGSNYLCLGITRKL